MLSPGDSAPDFRLPVHGAAPSSLQDTGESLPVLLAFFKSSCPVCQLTFPYLQRLSQRATGLRVVGVSQDDSALTAEFSRAFGITFPVMLDSKASKYAVSDSFGITNVPSLFLAEADRVLSMAVSGFSRSDLEALGRRFGAEIFEAGERTPSFKPG